ncbi:hypothetical protein [Paraburkholderia sp. MM5482-R1]|uniref:hypothetical protein n=1 Tax=unclassified Paraburkholderia TaxID=2615204 RepID=UPI003D1FDD8B
MKDAFERRALLLHLGDALQAIAAALATNNPRDTVRDLLDADAALATHAWLAAVPPDMEVAEFAKRVSASFAGWPAQLLEAQVDYRQLAFAVRSNLFANDPPGWHAYVGALTREVEWFGDALPAASETTGQSREAGDDDSPTSDTSDIETAKAERGGEAGDAQRESVESNGRLYPSWPWKPGG